MLFATTERTGSKDLFLKGPRKNISFLPRKKYLLHVRSSVGFTSLCTVAMHSFGQLLKRLEKVIPPPLILLKAHGVIKRIRGNVVTGFLIFLFKVVGSLLLIQNTNTEITFSAQYL